MMKNTMKLSICFALLSLMGCANEPQLGTALNQLQTEQTLNPNAWYDNLDYLPEGSGARTQASLKVYNQNSAVKK